jgi:probable F420-dependent oxidoreductase
MDLGTVGVFSFAFEQHGAGEAREGVARLEELGYGAIWIPEARGKEAFTHAAILLGGGSRITVATGVASIWGRDAVTAVAAGATVAEAYPDRLVVGLGVSHRTIVEDVRGQAYRAPLARMRAYLEAMAAAPYQAAGPPEPPPVVLAALGPRMLALAAEHSAGAHTYFVPVEHTAAARAALGSGALLAVELAVVLEADAARAREVARGYTERYLRLENYRNNLARLGWSDDDLAGAGTDRLVDALVAWGDEAAIATRVRAHLDAGADHVCIQVVEADRSQLCLDRLAALAPALLA